METVVQTGGRSWPLELVVCPALFLWFVTHTQAVCCVKKEIRLSVTFNFSLWMYYRWNPNLSNVFNLFVEWFLRDSGYNIRQISFPRHVCSGAQKWSLHSQLLSALCEYLFFFCHRVCLLFLYSIYPSVELLLHWFMCYFAKAHSLRWTWRCTQTIIFFHFIFILNEWSSSWTHRWCGSSYVFFSVDVL